MWFDLFFLLRGPARTVAAPNRSNPVQADSLAALLTRLAQNLPDNHHLGLECVGLEIKPAEAPPCTP